jgi:hypothetical protein
MIVRDCEMVSILSSFQTLYVGQWSDGLYAVPSFVDESIVTIRSLPDVKLPPLLEGPTTTTSPPPDVVDPVVQDSNDEEDKEVFDGINPGTLTNPFVLLGYYEVKETPLIGYAKDVLPPSQLSASESWALTQEELRWRKEKRANVNSTAGGSKKEAERKVDEEFREVVEQRGSFSSVQWVFNVVVAIGTSAALGIGIKVSVLCPFVFSYFLFLCYKNKDERSIYETTELCLLVSV